MTHFWQQFLAIVEKYPDNIAVQEENQSLTYADLARRAAAIGENLRKEGVQPETPVVLEFEKSTDYIAALLGCWYAGAAFVPLPPSLPAERRQHILRHAGIRHTVTGYNMPTPYQGPLQPVMLQDDTLAYIIYTSGSTGAPKGVMVEHRGITNFIQAQINSFGVQRDSRYLFYLSILFDAAISDIGVCLLSGAALVIEPPATLHDGSRLVKSLHKNKITHMDIPPALLKTLSPADMPESLQTIIIGGEACPPETVRQWAKKFSVINVYGPTEATVCTSLCRCDPDSWTAPLIGAPIAGIDYLVLDDKHQPAAEGELYIGGIGLARGYLNEPELTSQKFIYLQDRRLYKTGDKVKQLGPSDIEFLGRIDRQFKIRGQLVEPDEIEARLLSHTSVKKAAVLKRDEQLVAFVTADTDSTTLEIWLKKILPAWMIPQHFQFLDTFPLTGTGKTDYAALKEIPLAQNTSSRRIPPQTPMEQKIWDIWKTILKHENFGVTDDFFAMGGDSLGLIRMSLEAERQGLPFVGSSIATCRTIQRLTQEMQNIESAMSCEGIKAKVTFNAEQQALLAAAAHRPFISKTAPENIFLTGAAGFLGGKLLSELLERTDADIYCLIRASDPLSALQRIKKSLQKFSLELSPAQLSRIKPLCGDLSKPCFNLDLSRWNALTETVDIVYHCAAKVNMILTFQDLYDSNIQSTQEVLRFACTGRRKHLHYASTLSVFVATNQNEGRALETDRLEKVKYVYGGYAQTKWAAEWMLLQVPPEACTITHYRFGLITGDTQKGVCSDTDFLTMFARGISSLRTAPEGFDDKLYVDITPIDYAAKAMAFLSLHGKHDIYHIANPHSLSLGRLLQTIERQGGPIQKLPVKAWKDVIDNISVTAAETAAGLSLCRCLPEEFEKHRVMDLFQATNIVFDTTQTDTDLQPSGLACPSVSDALLDTYMNFIFKDQKPLIKICIFGPESTGKSTLTEKLAQYYHTAYAAEFAKDLIFAQNGTVTAEDIPLIAQGQIKNEHAAAETANRILFCDTDLLTTVIWSEWLFNTCPAWIKDAATLQKYDLYFLMDIDTPWVEDVHRFLPQEREEFLQKCQDVLEGHSMKYIKLSGNWGEKFDHACQEINKLLRKY